MKVLFQIKTDYKAEANYVPAEIWATKESDDLFISVRPRITAENLNEGLQCMVAAELEVVFPECALDMTPEEVLNFLKNADDRTVSLERVAGNEPDDAFDDELFIDGTFTLYYNGKFDNYDCCLRIEK